MATGHIYALIDPRNGAVRYVGQTVDKLNNRLAAHIAQPTNSKIAEWVDDLRSMGMRPQIKPLEEADISILNEREHHWFISFHTSGANLLNIAKTNQPRQVKPPKRRVARFPLALPDDVRLAVEAFARGDGSYPPATLNDAIVFLIRRGLEL